MLASARLSLPISLLVAGALTAQEPVAQEVLDALRTSIAEQEKAVTVLAWTAECRTTLGKGKEQRRAGELRARVVYEVKPNGNAHIWFEPQTSHWVDQDKFVSMSGEAVHRGRANASLSTSCVEGRAPTRAEGRVAAQFNNAYADIELAGAHSTLWPLHQHRSVRISALLKTARAEDVRIKENEVEVQLPGQRGQSASYRFTRHGSRYSLLERREEAGGQITSYRVLDEALLADKVWFPRRIRVEGHQGDEPREMAIEITDVRLDPTLAENTFTIVAPANTVFHDEKTKETFSLSAEKPELHGIVKLETEATKKPAPPTAPHPAKR